MDSDQRRAVRYLEALSPANRDRFIQLINNKVSRGVAVADTASSFLVLDGFLWMWTSGVPLYVIFVVTVSFGVLSTRCVAHFERALRGAYIRHELDTGAFRRTCRTQLSALEPGMPKEEPRRVQPRGRAPTLGGRQSLHGRGVSLKALAAIWRRKERAPVSRSEPIDAQDSGPPTRNETIEGGSQPEKTGMKTVWVSVKCLPECDDPDGVAGLWQVSLQEDLSPGHAVGAALDVFHGQVAIAVLDDFEIRGLDPNTQQQIHESEEYVQGTVRNGQVEYLGPELPFAGPSM